MIPIFKCQLVRTGSAKYRQPLTYDGTVRSILPLLRRELAGADREHHLVILLDTAWQVIGMEITGVGSLTSVSAGCREILKSALLCSASGIVTAHSHPSDDTRPSQQDREAHKRTADACAVLGVWFADDLILGNDGSYFSFSEERSANVTKQMKAERTRAAARSTRRITTGTACARDIVLTAADRIGQAHSAPHAEAVATLTTVIDQLVEISTTPRRIRRDTRGRAQQLLDLSRDLLDFTYRREWFPLSRLDAMSVPTQPPKRTVRPVVEDFIGAIAANPAP